MSLRACRVTCQPKSFWPCGWIRSTQNKHADIYPEANTLELDVPQAPTGLSPLCQEGSSSQRGQLAFFSSRRVAEP